MTSSTPSSTPLTCTVLGCGTSSGVPSLKSGWGACDPRNPKNRRSRCSILLQWQEPEQEPEEGLEEEEGKSLRTLLVDSSPDCREQLLRAKVLHEVRRLDAVLYTHDHADHCHGIDDLKWMRGEQPIPAYATVATMKSLTHRFGYIFDPAARSPLYRTVLSARTIEPWREFSLASSKIRLLPIALDHGLGVEVVGFRVGNLAYTTDCVSLSERAFDALAGVKVWIVGCLRREQHPTHAHVSRILAWAERVAAERVYLTHMNDSMDYAQLCEELPSHIRPAYDFLRISGEFPA